jgi:hypothetical protein
LRRRGDTRVRLRVPARLARAAGSPDGAPHLTNKGRAWFKVLLEDVTVYDRPKAQGGAWFLGQRMTVLEAA